MAPTELRKLYKYQHLTEFKKDVIRDKLVIEQDGKCAICGKSFDGERPPNVDHCHESGRVRGALCAQCNCGLGLFGDSLLTLEKAAQYLVKHMTVNTNH